MCIELKTEEGKIYEVCQLEKQIKMSYKMFQHLTRASESRLMDFMIHKQGVVIERNDDGQVEGPLNIE